jgi:hypothetical protein
MPRPDPVTSATLFSKSIAIQRIEGREPAGKNGPLTALRERTGDSLTPR